MDDIQWNLFWETTGLEGPPVLAESPTFKCIWTCHQRPPVLRDHIFMANRVVFQDRFYCTCILLSQCWAFPECTSGHSLPVLRFNISFLHDPNTQSWLPLLLDPEHTPANRNLIQVILSVDLLQLCDYRSEVRVASQFFYLWNEPETQR